MDYVNHQAAVCIRYCQTHPQEAIDINVKGTINVLEACVHNQVKKVVAASSASVYGDPPVLPIQENDPLLAKNLYGLTKIMNEASYTHYWREYKLPFVAFRYMNVYGPRQNTDAFYTSVIPLFVEKILASQPPTITGDGSQSMDFVHVSDVARANVLALKDDGCAQKFFNVGTGTETSIKMICDMLLKLMKSDLKPVYKPAISIDVNRRQSDISYIKKCLGWKPEINLNDGLQTVIDDIKARPRHG
jgi:UDP-glucose 4-epimerase